MSWADIEFTFANCLDMCQQAGRIPYFYITGGELILHCRSWETLSLIKEHQIPFTIPGNPFHPTGGVCSRLKFYDCKHYQLSPKESY